ncbi:MAG TPA: nucleotidyltransferase domain-containing protein [Anaerolineae bacterium]|mgnify:CR=1 FL=1|nr:nucleotidyltransferase domain-containing protein [Anaerolineae bacterium]
MAIDQILRQCKTTLQRYYGPRLKGVVVYGSVARQQAGTESDIDLLVLLAQPFNYFEETRQIIELLYPIQLESDHLISAKPAFLPDYERGRLQLYRTAKREGTVV